MSRHPRAGICPGCRACRPRPGSRPPPCASARCSVVSRSAMPTTVAEQPLCPRPRPRPPQRQGWPTSFWTPKPLQPKGRAHAVLGHAGGHCARAGLGHAGGPRCCRAPQCQRPHHMCGSSPTAARFTVSVSGPRGRWQRSVFGVSGHGDPAGKPLNRATGGRLGNVFAPERLLVSRPTLKFLAVADPLNPVVLSEDHLDGAGRECVRPENLYR